jgi:transcriptional antiterminator RfaH
MILESFDQWFAVQVRSRSEQMVETLLSYKGYRTWSPGVPKAAAGKRSKRLEPLFPGYVFCQMGDASQGLIVTTPGVLRFVGPGGRPHLVPPAEIAAIHAVLSSGLPALPAAMQPGCSVEVVAGPLKGCCGTVVDWKQPGLLLIGITLLRRAVSVVVESQWLRPLLPKPIVSAGLGHIERPIHAPHAAWGGAPLARPEWRPARRAQVFQD